MNLKKNHKKQAAASFLEYAIILGVVSVVLIGMNTYIKRGIQGRLKEMTDYFISDQQVVEVNPTATTNSSVDRLADATVNGKTLIGGGTSSYLLETTDISATIRVEDKDVPASPGSIIPAEEGGAPPIVPPKQ